MSNAFLKPKHFYWLSDAIVIYILYYSVFPPPQKKRERIFVENN